MAGGVTNDHQSHCVGRGRGRVCDCVCVCVCVSVVAIARLMFQVSRHALECPLKPGTPRPRESKGGVGGLSTPSIDDFRTTRLND